MSSIRYLLAASVSLAAVMNAHAADYTSSLLYSQSYVYGRTYSAGINNAGQIAGEFSLPKSGHIGATERNYTSYVGVWDGSTLINVGSVSTMSAVTDINNAGQVAGYDAGSDFADARNSRGVVWQISNGARTTNSQLGLIEGINDVGQSVGTVYLGSASLFAPALWNGSTPQILSQRLSSSNPNFDMNSQANGINNHGLIVGDSYGHAVTWQGASLTLTDLGEGTAAAVNDVGDIVGSSGGAVVWRNGAKIALGTLGGMGSGALDINEVGQIVGSASTSAGKQHATLWVGQDVIDLNQFLDAQLIADGWELQSATGINDSGDISVDGYNASKNQYGVFRLTSAVPEPASWVLMLLGFSLLASIVRKSKSSIV
ncbi:MAG: PEP-CTERM sorting domain-containing protein [Aquabacterium sp.]|uniref:PEP-CTERM sorting domain-containing protein n=1 Tax=Aquabacterium sp. TaxID=1872578 RepID=UPI0011F8B83B|nr:PEP-CTERM sorting domain-containing protein [Aquabacterium sp.]TAK92661.1 MAG: PEP-CTERM sorting domain-containing protein [Aquabacterium sp.]